MNPQALNSHLALSLLHLPRTLTLIKEMQQVLFKAELEALYHALLWLIFKSRRSILSIRTFNRHKDLDR